MTPWERKELEKLWSRYAVEDQPMSDADHRRLRELMALEAALCVV